MIKDVRLKQNKKTPANMVSVFSQVWKRETYFLRSHFKRIIARILALVRDEFSHVTSRIYAFLFSSFAFNGLDSS
jgi:hypothetical protein